MHETTGEVTRIVGSELSGTRLKARNTFFGIVYERNRIQEVNKETVKACTRAAQYIFAAFRPAVRQMLFDANAVYWDG